VHGIYLRPSSLCVLLGFLRGTVGIAEDAQPALLLAKCSQSTCSWHLLPCLHKLKGKPSLKYKIFLLFSHLVMTISVRIKLSSKKWI